MVLKQIYLSTFVGQADAPWRWLNKRVCLCNVRPDVTRELNIQMVMIARDGGRAQGAKTQGMSNLSYQCFNWGLRRIRKIACSAKRKGISNKWSHLGVWQDEWTAEMRACCLLASFARSEICTRNESEQSWAYRSHTKRGHSRLEMNEPAQNECLDFERTKEKFLHRHKQTRNKLLRGTGGSN